jgi:DNA-binding HxlR family transcriptional regulator
VSDPEEQILLALKELQSEEYISSEFRENPFGDNYFLTSKGKHIANVLHHSVQIPLSKANRSIQHLLK